MTRLRISDEDLKLDIKTPAELEEEFKRMDRHVQKAILNNYELLGLAVIRAQANDYKNLYEAYKEQVNYAKKINLYHSMIAIERWFDSDLGKYCLTELSGKELCKKLRDEVDKNAKGKKGDIKYGN